MSKGNENKDKVLWCQPQSPTERHTIEIVRPAYLFDVHRVRQHLNLRPCIRVSSYQFTRQALRRDNNQSRSAVYPRLQSRLEPVIHPSKRAAKSTSAHLFPMALK